jgi:GR25 family glycosyltransferase involved in LPS biosynthesis
MSINGIDIIYWINLDSSKDRSESMQEMFKDACFKDVKKIQRFPAINGSYPGIIEKMLNLQKRPLNDGEYGCLISHLDAIRKFSESEYDTAIIMEDDSTLEFKKYWREDTKTIIDNAPSDWEIIMLSYISNDIPEKKYTYNKNQYWSAIAYIINKKGAKHLMRQIYFNGKYNIEPEINNESDQYIFQKIPTYVYKYPMFIYKYEETSTLHQGAVPRHDQSKRRIEEMYNALTDATFLEGFTNSILEDNYLIQKSILYFVIFIISIIMWFFSSDKISINGITKSKIFSNIMKKIISNK